MMEQLKSQINGMDMIIDTVSDKLLSHIQFKDFYCSSRNDQQTKFADLFVMDKEIKSINIKKNKILRKIHGFDINATVIDDTPEEYEAELKRVKNINNDNNNDNADSNFSGLMSSIPLSFSVDNKDIVINEGTKMQETKPTLEQISFSETKILEDQDSYFTNKNLFGSSDFKKMSMGRDIFDYLHQSDDESSKAMREGTAIHMYMFEEEKFAETVIGVTGSKGSLEPTESTLVKAEKENEGKIAIGKGLYDMLPQMKEKLLADEYVAGLLGSIDMKEVGLVGKLSFTTTDNIITDFNVRCKHDFIVRDHEKKTVLICDLKTTDKQEMMNAYKWKYQIKSFSYDLQAYLYTEMLKDFDRNNGIDVDNYQYSFAHLVLLRKEPFALRFWTLGDYVLSGGEIKLIEAINVYRRDVTRGTLC